jgi:hypothetical protein
MLVFFTQGVGMFIGYKIADYQIRPVKGLSGELTAAIGSDRAAETLTFSEQLANMFAVKMPASIHTELLTKTSELWKAYWLLPAGMAAAIAVIFFIAFRDRSVNAREEE